MYVAVTERQATPTQVFSYGIVYLHFYEIKLYIYYDYVKMAKVSEIQEF